MYEGTAVTDSDPDEEKQLLQWNLQGGDTLGYDHDNIALILEKLAKPIRVHREVTEKTLKLVRKVGIVALLLAFIYLLRNNIFVLYARTLTGCPSASGIAVIVYLSYVVSGFSSLFFGYLCDVWYCDYLLCIAACLDVITFWIEATATNFWQLAIVYAVGGQAIMTIILCFVYKTLPIYHSVQYQITLQQYAIIAATLSPALGGVIAYLISYRSVFIISAILACVLFIYCLVEIGGTYKYIMDMQNKISNIYVETQEDRYQLIHILNNFNNNNNNNSNSSNKHNGDTDATNTNATTNTDELYKERWNYLLENNIVTNDMTWLISDDYKFLKLLTRNKSYHRDDPTTGPVMEDLTSLDSGSVSSLSSFESSIDNNNNNNNNNSANKYGSTYQLSLLLSLSLIIAILQCSETATSAWFTVYLEDKYGGNVLLATIFLSYMTLALLVGIILIKVILKKKPQLAGMTNNNNNSNNSSRNGSGNGEQQSVNLNLNRFLVVSSAIGLIFRTIGSCFVLTDDTLVGDYKASYWIYLFFNGLFFGVAYVSIGALVVPLQPYETSGKLAGIRRSLIYFVKGLGSLIVGILWQYNYSWFWYADGLFSFAALFILAAIVLDQYFRYGIENKKYRKVGSSERNLNHVH